MRELFIVEGQSAAFALKRVLKAESQSVLALQGKLPNAAKRSKKVITTNIQCKKLFQQLGVGIKEDCQPKNLPFDRIILLMDANIDGVHSLYLLITLFQHYLSPLLATGKVEVMRPPLYLLNNEQFKYHQFASSEDEKKRYMAECDFDCEVRTFSGLATYSFSQLTEILNNCNRRPLVC